MNEIAAISITDCPSFDLRAQHSQFGEIHWYVAYTSAKHEKKVFFELHRRSVECFLPLYASLRRWKDRRVSLELPLFPGYVFVRFAIQDRLTVLRIPGVAKIVGFGGYPVALPDDQIQSLRLGLQQLRAQPHPFLTVGRRVSVKKGPLRGLQGIVIRRKNSVRLVISLDLIQRSASVEIDESDLQLM